MRNKLIITQQPNLYKCINIKKPNSGKNYNSICIEITFYNALTIKRFIKLNNNNRNNAIKKMRPSISFFK